MVIPYEENPWRGVSLDGTALPGTKERFAPMLAATLAELGDKGYLLAWLRLAPARVELAAVCLESGFEFHHADSDGLLMVKRIDPDAPVPGYATHFIGVGGVVLDEEGRILVIQERYHKAKHWKLPGGGLDPGEHIAHAAVREVREETGIEAEFLSLHCFRHWHGYRYGKSDIYFVCRLKPLSSEIAIDPVEISEARWMDVGDYLGDPDTHPFNRKIVETALNTPGLHSISIPDYGGPETHELLF